MDQETKRLGSLLQAAREARRPRLHQPDAAELLGVSRTTVQNIESGRFAKVNRTVREYARVLGWPDGAADRVAAGGPAPAVQAEEAEAEAGIDPDTAEAAPLPLPPAVDYELRNSETLDASVINWGPDDEDGHIIVVLQGKKGASPEEVARLARRYRKARRYLQNLAAEDDGVADT
ncbi:helix-turn-helix transcriptional regulator [Streptomyces sp. enrichment culture]|uniref:helix-turn-helix transcriptional regulator n=1 Tax=Streptomyces sp. enrichment culture TaxID=1795815 RepID=UPI003F565751